MKILKFVTSLLKDFLKAIGGFLLMLLGLAIVFIVLFGALFIPILLPFYVTLIIFKCEYAAIASTIIGFLLLICLLDGSNPITLIKKDIKSIKKYIITKWNESGQS